MRRQGTVKLERGGWRTWLGWLASFVVAVPVLWLAVGWMADLGLDGLMLQVCAAVTSLGLFWGLLSCFGTLFSSGDAQTVRWTLTEDTLRLGKDAIPRESIRMVHCWKRGDRHVVNIETTGRNRVLRGVPGQGSDEALRALVEALGYGRKWE